MVSFAHLQQVEPRLASFEEAPVSEECEGWHVVAVGKSGEALGSGWADSRELARTVAISEMLERRLFERVCVDYKAEAAVDRMPTSCGFAFGFDLEQTQRRSQREAVERWAWSKWIDERIPLREVSQPKLSALGQTFSSRLAEVSFFLSPQIRFALPNGEFGTGFLHVAIGQDETGAFAGSQFTSERGQGWSHALIESWRHRLLSRNALSIPNEDVILQRIIYFGRHRDEALRQIPSSAEVAWPDAKIDFSWTLMEPLTRGYLVRHLCADYRSWHCGGYDRFVY